jgi:tRNA threonylcarbamoyladenosine biosynthesis protein TsaE
LPLYHFDLYRLEDPDEIWSLGFADYFAGDGLCVVEWAERAGNVWMDFSWLWLEFQVTGATARHVEIRCQGERGRILMANCLLR